MMPLALMLAVAICPQQHLQAARFTVGEVLSYRLDALGADVGTFEVRVQPPPPTDKRAALELTSRAKTSAFISTNVGRYEAFAKALLAPDFTPLHYHEDVDEGPLHKAADAEFPPGPTGALTLQFSTNGNPEPAALNADADVRDVISTFYVLRAQPMKAGSPVCLEVFAGRKIWKVTGAVGPRETITTPIGRFATVRIDTDSVRTDDPRVRRSAHVWVTDDERRLPLVAVGEVKGKVLRAQLTQVSGSRVARRR